MKWRMPKGCCCAIEAGVISACLSSVCFGAHWRVDAGAPEGDCEPTTDWAYACKDLQDVLENPFIAEKDVIWVAAGTYYPTDTTDRDASFELVNNVELYGGFAGTETLLEERDIVSNLTMLSGNIGLPEDDSDNSYHVVVSAWHDADTRIDGFRITHGRADGALGKGKGGGMLLRTTEAAVVR